MARRCDNPNIGIDWNCDGEVDSGSVNNDGDIIYQPDIVALGQKITQDPTFCDFVANCPGLAQVVADSPELECLFECPTYTRTTISTITLPNVTPEQIGPPFDLATLNTTLLASEVCAPLETNTTNCNMRCKVTIDGRDVGVKNHDGSIILLAGWKITVKVNGANVIEEFRRSYQNGNPSPNFNVGSPTSFNYSQTLAPGDTLEVCLQPYAFFGQSGTPEELLLQFLQPDVQIDCEPTPC